MNKARIIGSINNITEYTYNKEDYLSINVNINRGIKISDNINVSVKKNLVKDTLKKDDTILVEGMVKSRSKYIDNKRKLLLFISCSNIMKVDSSIRHMNCIEIEGSILKKTGIRKTFTGKEITDILIKLDNKYYIPTITWGSIASYVDMILEDNDSVIIKGKLQSRSYVKDNKVYVVNELSTREISLNKE